MGGHGDSHAPGLCSVGPRAWVPLLAPSCPDCLAVGRPPHPQASASRWKANDTSACLTGYGAGSGELLGKAPHTSLMPSQGLLRGGKDAGR